MSAESEIFIETFFKDLALREQIVAAKEKVGDFWHAVSSDPTQLANIDLLPTDSIGTLTDRIAAQKYEVKRIEAAQEDLWHEASERFAGRIAIVKSNVSGFGAYNPIYQSAAVFSPKKVTGKIERLTPLAWEGRFLLTSQRRLPFSFKKSRIESKITVLETSEYSGVPTNVPLIDIEFLQ